MDAGDKKEIRYWLVPGEKLLWASRSRGIHTFEWRDLFMVLVFLNVTGFWIVGGPEVAGFIGVVGLAVSVLVVYQRSNILYVLTDRRVIVLDSRFSKFVRILPLHSLYDVQVKLGVDGTGTVTCLSDSRDWPYRDQFGDPVKGVLFRSIDSPGHVYATLVEAQPAIVAQKSSQMTLRAESQIRKLLVPGEQLLWSGRPRSGIRFDLREILQVLLSLPLIGIPVYIVREAFATRDPRREGIGAVNDTTLTFLLVSAAILMLLGIYRIILKNMLDARRRSRLVYGLTSQRAIILDTRYSQFVRSIALEPLTSIDIEMSRDGAGTITCRSDAEGWLYPRKHKGSETVPLFQYIDSPEVVYSLMTGARLSSAHGESAQ